MLCSGGSDGKGIKVFVWQFWFRELSKRTFLYDIATLRFFVDCCFEEIKLKTCEISDKMADVQQQHQLSQEQIDHFVKHGWLKLENCFSKDQAGDLQKNLWTRLGMDPEDMSTWYVIPISSQTSNKSLFLESSTTGVLLKLHRILG
jgi:hypothetical protein